MPTATHRVGDRVKIRNTFFEGHRHLNDHEGTISRVIAPVGAYSTGYHVKLDTGEEVLTYSVEPASPAPDSKIVVDIKRAQAFMLAKDTLPADTLVSDIVEAARFVLGEDEPAPAPIIGGSLTVTPAAMQFGTLVPAIDVDRRTVNEGFSARGVQVFRDRSADDDLVRFNVASSVTAYLPLEETENLISYLQAAVRVGRVDGTQPPFPEPTDTPF